MTSKSLFEKRIEALSSALSKAGIDAAAVVPGANFYFLTGVHFHLMERPTILFIGADGAKRAIIPVLERSRWQAAAPDVDSVFWQDSDGFDAAFAEAARRFSPNTIGVEGQRMRVFEGDALRAHFKRSLIVDAHQTISSARLCKDATEVAALRRAIAISERAFEEVLVGLRVGMSELDVKKSLSTALMEGGADALALAGGLLVMVVARLRYVAGERRFSKTPSGPTRTSRMRVCRSVRSGSSDTTLLFFKVRR